MMGKTLLLVAAVAGGIVLAPSLAAGSAETPYGTPDGSLEGRSYQTLRALALHLDETARGALESAINEVRRGASAHARFLTSIRAFGPTQTPGRTAVAGSSTRTAPSSASRWLRR